ncbi:MAG: hypothetical protein WDO71_00945 [Bacteroidota bacterium]
MVYSIFYSCDDGPVTVRIKVKTQPALPVTEKILQPFSLHLRRQTLNTRRLL